MVLSQIKQNCLDFVVHGKNLGLGFRGNALGSADLGQVPVLCLLVMSRWTRCLNFLGISFLVYEEGMIILLPILARMNGNTVGNGQLPYLVHGLNNHSLTKIIVIY